MSITYQQVISKYICYHQLREAHSIPLILKNLDGTQTPKLCLYNPFLINNLDGTHSLAKASVFNKLNPIFKKSAGEHHFHILRVLLEALSLTPFPPTSWQPRGSEKSKGGKRPRAPQKCSNIWSLGDSMFNPNEMTREELVAYINKIENAPKASGGIKVGDKGGVSVYGIGRFPVTLYRSQWEKLFAKKAEIEAFIVAHADELAAKPVKE